MTAAFEVAPEAAAAKTASPAGDAREPPESARVRRWPLVLIASPAAVAIWSGWVGLGGLCGFGPIHPLPGIADGFRSTPRSRCRSASRRTARTRCGPG